MRDLFILLGHLLTATAKLLRPGGARAVAAESALLKQQLLVINRSRQRAPNLSVPDRFLFGFWSLFLGERRIQRDAVILKPSTLLRFHEALKKRKYRLLFTPRTRSKPGPKGPSQELIQIIVEIKRRNPRFGCPRIAQQIANAFGIEIDKDVVRRVLAKYYDLSGPVHKYGDVSAAEAPRRQGARLRRTLSGTPQGAQRGQRGCIGCPDVSVLMNLATKARGRGPVLAHLPRAPEGQFVERGSVSMRVDSASNPLGDGGHGPIHAAHHWLRGARGQRRWHRDLPDVQQGDFPDGRSLVSELRS